MNVVVIGGTSGLGLEIAKRYASAGDEVVVTGRHDPAVTGIEYRELDLAKDNVVERIEEFVESLSEINVLVYAAGYFQEGTVTDLTAEQIEEMLNVGGRGLIYAVRAVLQKQDKLDMLVTITSTSQWTPRKLEPIYNFAKAGAGHFSNAMAEDGRVGKVLVVGPAGMNTDFWEGVERDDKATMNDPADVAAIVLKHVRDNYKYRFVKILRDPLREEVAETR